MCADQDQPDQQFYFWSPSQWTVNRAKRKLDESISVIYENESLHRAKLMCIECIFLYFFQSYQTEQDNVLSKDKKKAYSEHLNL